MDEKQILKEIAYYSRIINQHKKWEQSYQPNKYVKPPMKAQVNLNKYKYVKKNEPSVIIPVQSIAVPSKVLINPNFKTSVHINPHFTIANQQSSTIHVNPKVLNHQLTLNRVQAISKIKLNTVANMCNIVKPVVVPKSPARKRRSSIRSKYKIVKSSVLNTSVKCVQVNKQFTATANMYKIDRRNTSILNRSIARRKIVTYGLSDLIRNKVFRNKTWKKTKVLDHFKVNNNSALTNISGIMYRKSVTKLQKVDKTVAKTNSVCKHNLKQRRCLVNIKGCKYVMDSNKRTLKLVSNNAITNKKHPIVKKISIKGVTFVQKTKNTYVRRNVSGHNLRKFKLHQNKLQVSGCLRKNNIPCPVYRRFGKCRRKESDRCSFLHNPDQIFLCKKFLQGACIDNDCLLSHKVSLEKMPTCKYFLEGCCIRSECSYLHVKINPKADICKKFLEGFCKDGNKCNKRHQFLCPNFERDGKCPRRKCMYPHKNKTDKDKSVPVKQAIAVHNRVEPAASEAGLIETARYYVDLKPSNDLSALATCTEPPSVRNEVTTEVSNIEHNSDLEPDTEVRRRPQLGALPSFIPF